MASAERTNRTCKSCNTISSPEAKYCKGCGLKMAIFCSDCGHKLDSCKCSKQTLTLEQYKSEKASEQAQQHHQKSVKMRVHFPLKEIRKKLLKEMLR